MVMISITLMLGTPYQDTADLDPPRNTRGQETPWEGI